MNIITSWQELTTHYGENHGWAIMVVIIIPIVWVIYRMLAIFVSDSGTKNMITRIFCTLFALSVGIPLLELGLGWIWSGKEMPDFLSTFFRWLTRTTKYPKNAVPYVMATAAAYRMCIFLFRITLKARGLYILDLYNHTELPIDYKDGQDAENVRIANETFGYGIKIYHHLWFDCIKYHDVSRIQTLDYNLHLIS